MYNTKYCKVQQLKEKNAIFFEWKEFCRGDDYRDPFMYAMKKIKKYHITTWITDTTNGFENEEADTIWLLKEFVPVMVNSSIEKIIFIIAPNSPLMEEIKAQEQALKDIFEVKLLDPKEYI